MFTPDRNQVDFKRVFVVSTWKGWRFIVSFRFVSREEEGFAKILRSCMESISEVFFIKKDVFPV